MVYILQKGPKHLNTLGRCVQKGVTLNCRVFTEQSANGIIKILFCIPKLKKKVIVIYSKLGENARTWLKPQQIKLISVVTGGNAEVKPLDARGGEQPKDGFCRHKRIILQRLDPFCHLSHCVRIWYSHLCSLANLLATPLIGSLSDGMDPEPPRLTIFKCSIVERLTVLSPTKVDHLSKYLLVLLLLLFPDVLIKCSDWSTTWALDISIRPHRHLLLNTVAVFTFKIP